MSKRKKISLVVAGVVTTGAVLGGVALATSATGAPSPAPTGTATDGGARGSADTPVTGAELAKVTAAVKAKDSTITVTSVRRDPDGSYDVYGTKGGTQVVYDFSADLSTLTPRSADHAGR